MAEQKPHDPSLPSGTDKREFDTIACTNCGCSWKAGMAEEAQIYILNIRKLGYGLVVVPDCDGKCGCHTGKGLLPHLRVSMRWREKMNEDVAEALKRLGERYGRFN